MNATRVTHPIYGPGTVMKAARGTFAYVRFDNATNVSSAEGENTLAVSLTVCSKT